MLTTRNEWSDHLRAAARGALTGTPLGDPASTDEPLAWIENFRDDAEHRRAIDRPFLSYLLGTDPGPAPDRTSPAEALWWSLHEASSEPFLLVNTEGSLVPERGMALEVWTEEELGALHALSRFAMSRRAPELSARVDAAVRWLIEHVQPDNATNHPWAIHCFVMESVRPASPVASEARMYAETLLHNCLVGRGVPDRFSACILTDAADALAGLDRKRSRH
jgi:hypothetical protein